MSKLKKVEMRVLDPKVRATNFEEVALGYTEEEAILEAQRCLNCKKKPCVQGCPVNIDIPAFIQKAKTGSFEEAFQEINKYSSLSGICGRVCPQERQCEMYCVRGIRGESVAIGRLERFVSDYHLEHDANISLPEKENKYKALIVGSGPAGLACASELAKAGSDVTIYEALHEPGGVLTYGIPEFRLPKRIVRKEIDNLKQLGVNIVCNVVVGQSVTIDEMMEEYDSIFIGTGAGFPKFMNIEGKNLNGVFSANEFLTRINLMKAYDDKSDTPILDVGKVVVIGGGNVAMDAARCAKRLGSEVTVVYRRSREELPARKEEVEHAYEEGIDFRLLSNPIKIVPDDDNRVKSIECVKMRLLEKDESGRRRPVAIDGSEFTVDCDCVIMAIGTSPNPILSRNTRELTLNKYGCIETDENGKTSIDGIYAGGDTVTGAATVIQAMGAGKKAAKAMIEYMKGNKNG